MPPQIPTHKAPPRVHPLKRYPGARLIYNRERDSSQVWDLGNGKLYKFRPHRRGVYESDIHDLIQRATTIPVPVIYREWVSDEGGKRVHHMTMQKIDGEPMYKAWISLRRSEKEGLVLQLADYLDQLRRITSSSIRSAGGGPLHDEHSWLFHQRNASHGPFSDNQSLWLALTPHLRQSRSHTMQEALVDLRSIMPRSLPAVLTHTDLHQGNILVRNGKIAAIIDWELAGFFPCWMEYVKYYPTGGGRESEFESAVVRRMRPYPDARRFKMILDALGSSDLRTVVWGVKELRR